MRKKIKKKGNAELSRERNEYQKDDDDEINDSEENPVISFLGDKKEKKEKKEEDW